MIDDNASSQTVCKDPLSGKGKLSFLFVPPFGIALMIINQAKWKQMPVMTIIAIVGYLANFYSAARFTGNPQVSSAVGAFAIAALANLYSRISLDEAVKSITRRVRRTVGKVRIARAQSCRHLLEDSWELRIRDSVFDIQTWILPHTPCSEIRRTSFPVARAYALSRRFSLTDE